MIKNGRTVVPLRFIAESILATVTYDSTNGKIVIVLGSTTITLQINHSETTIEEMIDGKKTSRKIILESPPFILQGRTLVPVRFISEAFGLEVEWDDEEQKITIKNSQEAPKERIETGLRKESIDLNGIVREYYTFVPTSYTGDKPCPVVFVFHGGGGTASGVMWETRWNEIASKEGFICVYPEGTRKDSSKPANFLANPQSWNDGSNRKTNEAMLQNVDDSNFIRQLIQLLQTTHNIDKNHIHATGFSNGAGMSFRVGREVSDLFASIAPVSGCDYLENKPNELPLSLFYITGTKDPLNPMEGGEIFIGPISQGIKPPILEMLQKWVQKIKAPIVSETVSESDTLATVKYKPGVNGSEIIFTMVKNLGHYWPGGRYQLPESILGSRENLDAMNATKEIWDFFRSHPKNQLNPFQLSLFPELAEAGTTLHFSIVCHIEPFQGGKQPDYRDEKYFRAQEQSLEKFTKMLETHGAKLTIQAQKPFTDSCIKYKNILPDLEEKGHEIATHFHEDIWVETSASREKRKQALSDMKQSVDQLGVTNHTLCGGWQWKDISEIALEVGFRYLDNYKNPKTQIGLEKNMTVFPYRMDGASLYIPEGIWLNVTKPASLPAKAKPEDFDRITTMINLSFPDLKKEMICTANVVMHLSDFLPGKEDELISLYDEYLTKVLDPVVKTGLIQYSTIAESGRLFEESEQNAIQFPNTKSIKLTKNYNRKVDSHTFIVMQ